MKNCSSDWKNKPFPECIKPVRFERSKQIQTNSYLPSGDFPIIDQGQSKIAGWTNDKSTVINDNLPLIVFGDHTRVFKYIDFHFAIGADGTKLIKPDEDEFCSRYFYYYLMNLNLPSKGYSRHYNLLKESEISYPEIPEQQKIAAVLFKIQQAIEAQESIIEAAQELKKSTMQHVFTYGLRGEKTKETEVGRVPESWSLKPAIEVFTLTSGKTRPENIADRKNHETRYPVYGGNGVMGYSTKFFLSSKALVLGRVGEYCGVVHISHDKSWITDNALYSKKWLDSGTSIDYVALYLTFFDLNKLKRRSSQPLISQSIVYQQKIPIPDNQEQQKIVNILKSIDNKIKLHIGKKSGLHDLFKTVLNKLMTGEVRVKDLDINFSEVV
jgi:type I restriction enzyme S subunit